VKIIAHRGIHQSVETENSRSALEAIYSSNADGIEIDVRLTRDGVCVLSHDTKTKSKQRITRKSYEDLLEKDPNILRIDEAMEILTNYRGLINLEIKHIFGERDRKMGQRLIEVLASNRKKLFEAMERNLLISSFSTSNLKLAKELMPQISRALLVAKPTNYKKLIDTARDLECEAIHLHLRRTKSPQFADFVEKAAVENLKVRVFTVNVEYDFLKLKDAKVDGVFTDEVEKLFALNF